MLRHVEKHEALTALARHRKRLYDLKTVRMSSVAAELQDGWSVNRENKNTVQLTRRKASDSGLRDRVWSLLYRAAFTHLSTDNRPTLDISRTEQGEIDVVGIDDEVAIAARCLAKDTPTRWKDFEVELASFAKLRPAFEEAVANQYPRPLQRQIVTAVFLQNVHLSPHERKVAKDYNIVVFDERDLAYYESLISHLGSAAKYQLFADMLPGSLIPGLSLRLPAIRSKMGTFFCYTFSISPAYLLKIGFVSHRSKGQPSDVNAYQRMVAKARLNRIKEYISEDGIFPTNIVVSLESSSILFEPAMVNVQSSDDLEGGVAGSLTIRGTFKCAWIIDGQHRLYAYSGHPLASESRLSVLAFEGLPLSTQAKLFIDINAKQKSVRPSLLQELYADLKWDADDPKARIGAIISKAIQELGRDPESPLFDRIQTVDAPRSDTRCISLPAMFRELERGNFYIGRERHGKIIEYGALGAVDNDLSLERTIYVLKHWFGSIRDSAKDWWELGAAEGGGLSMNDGVAALIAILRSVYQHLEANGTKLSQLTDSQLVAQTRPFAVALGEHLASLSESDRKKFRDLRGNQGMTTRTRKLQQGIREDIPTFNPSGLDEFLKLEEEQTNTRAKEIIDRVEVGLQRLVLTELRQQIGPDESEWWTLGVPKQIRKKVTDRLEEDDGKRGGREYYFDLIDYRSIVQHKWPLFESLLSYGGRGRDKGTSWIAHLNDKRRIVAHASSGRTLTLEELSELEAIDAWFAKVSG